MLQFNKSKSLFEASEKIIPGGVNSPVRAFKSVGMNPLYIERGKDGHIWDADGNEYIDFISSWGPLLIGHGNPIVRKAIEDELYNGTSYGACNRRELEMAELVTAFFPSIEKVRMVNSGTEATMSAIRLARGYTGRDKIIKFDGCYHGHADSFLINAGSGLATYSTSGSAGITQGVVKDTLIATYGNIDSVKKFVEVFPDEIAAVIIEPIMGNMGLIPPPEGFLKELRLLTEEYGILLIFDEVISGFRAAKGGAQELYNVRPDLTCLGKIIGGGLPVGAFGGRADIMDYLSPIGPVYQAGTLSGNPLAMAAGIAMLKVLSKPDFYSELELKSKQLGQMIEKVLASYQDKLSFNRVGSLMTIFFISGGVKSNEQAKHCDTQLYARYFREMLLRGIYLPPSQFECMFVSMAHSEDDFIRTTNAIEQSLSTIFD